MVEIDLILILIVVEQIDNKRTFFLSELLNVSTNMEGDYNLYPEPSLLFSTNANANFK